MSSSPNASLIRELVGSELASVVFVWDYIQLVFQPAVAGAAEPGVLLPLMTGVFGTLSAYTIPALEDDGRFLRSGEPGYRDTLVEQIGRRVMHAEEADDYLRIEFDRGVIVTLSLNDDDLVGPESAMLQLHDLKQWMVWRPGDRTG